MFCYKLNYPTVYTSIAETISWLVNYLISRKLILLWSSLSHFYAKTFPGFRFSNLRVCLSFSLFNFYFEWFWGFVTKALGGNWEKIIVILVIHFLKLNCFLSCVLLKRFWQDELSSYLSPVLHSSTHERKQFRFRT